MVVLVTYDVRTDDEVGRRRLRRVAKVCENWGQRVQNSVFECLVDAAQWTVLKAALCREIVPAEDSLRFCGPFFLAPPHGANPTSYPNEVRAPALTVSRIGNVRLLPDGVALARASVLAGLRLPCFLRER